jgi:hypothetical protein
MGMARPNQFPIFWFLDPVKDGPRRVRDDRQSDGETGSTWNTQALHRVGATNRHFFADRLGSVGKM